MFAEKHISPARKMLVVDDDSDFRWAITNVLRGAGYRVAQAQDGDEALSLLEKDIPDMIFLD
ncbi:MAG: response regulator, partial [Planctomycetes bacterium]|nr:response regulator [Planctomycetota bacterium]